MLRKYLSVGIVILMVGMACLGIWFVSRLNRTLEAEVGYRAGNLLETTLADYAGAFDAGPLAPAVQARLDAHFQQISRPIGVFDMIVWAPTGRVVYAARREITGQSFPVGAQLQKAMTGQVSVEIKDRLHTDPSAGAAAAHAKFFEIYVPIRLAGGNRIVAVAEYYQDAAEASKVLTNIRWQMWAAIVTTAFFFSLVLYLLLRQGDAALSRQRREFGSRLTGLARQQQRQENRLRQLNADIHDGIGQLLTVALLRMKPVPDRDPGDPEAQAVRTLLEEAMNEVRALLSGTSQSQPPDMPLAQAIGAVVADHIRRTGTGVDLVLDPDLAEPSAPIRAAICRFVREGLHNAFKHAGGADQQVILHATQAGLEVSVIDGGRRPAAPADPDPREPLGLAVLRRRIELLGGTVGLVRDGARTRLRATFPLVPAEALDA